jgi:hypothetical protein
LYGFAEEDLAAAAKGTVVADQSPRCPSCQQSMQVGSVMCTYCGYNLKTKKKVTAMKATGKAPVAAVAGGGGAAVASPMLGYANTVRRTEKQTDDSSAKHLWFEYWIPSALIVVGMFLNYLQLTKFDRVVYSSQDAMKMMALGVGIDVVLLIVGSLLAIQLLDVSLGSPGSAILKIIAIAIGPAAIGNMASYLAHDPTHMLAFAITLGMAMILLCYLFDFDAKDARIFACMVAIIRIWLGYGLVFLILNGGFSPASHLGSAELNSDREASDAIDNGWAIDAKAWLDKGGRLIGHSVILWDDELVDSLHNAGCPVVDVRPSGGYAYEFYAELPSDPAKRADCFKAANKFYSEMSMPGLAHDKGQTYLVMHFD